MQKKTNSYKLDKQEQEIVQLNQEKVITTKNQQLLILSFIVFIVVISIIIMLLVHRYKKKSLMENFEMEKAQQQLLRAQMNPHFISNGLVAIQDYIYKSEKKIAANYLAKFSKLMRAIIGHSSKEYIPFDDEISTLKMYFDLQKLRFKNSFEYQINIDPSIDINDTLVPPMIAQPFIENAIEHGISDIDRMGLVEINFVKKDDLLNISVLDNGIGIDKNRSEAEEDRISYAMKITKQRLSLLAKNTKLDLRMEVSNRKDTFGAQINFSIPDKRIF